VGYVCWCAKLADGSVLARDVRLSGRAVLDLRASLNTTQSNISALLIDYGQAAHVGRGGSDGVTHLM